MSERHYKLLNGYTLVVSEEYLGAISPNGMKSTVESDEVIDDVLALVDVGNEAARELEYAKKQAGIWNDEAVRLRKELEEARKIKFPRQADGEGGWTIDYDFLNQLETRVYKESDYSADLEDLETILLALERVLGQEGEGNQ